MARVHYVTRKRSGWWWVNWLFFLPLLDAAFTVMMKAALVWPYVWTWKALKAVGRQLKPAR